MFNKLEAGLKVTFETCAFRRRTLTLDGDKAAYTAHFAN